MTQGSLNPKIRFLGKKCARSPLTDTQTHNITFVLLIFNIKKNKCQWISCVNKVHKIVYISMSSNPGVINTKERELNTSLNVGLSASYHFLQKKKFWKQAQRWATMEAATLI